MKRILIFLAGAGVVLLLLILLMQDVLLQFAFENIFSRVTGFKTTIADFHYQYPGAFHIRGLKLHNPPEFENRIFVDCSRVTMILNMPEFVRRENLRIYLVEISIDEVHLEKTPRGISNLQRLKALRPGMESGKSLPFQLDHLQLTVHHFDYWDKSAQNSKKISPNLKIEREELGAFKDSRLVFGAIAMKITEGTEFEKDLGL